MTYLSYDYKFVPLDPFATFSSDTLPTAPDQPLPLLCAGESLPPPAVRGVAEVKKPCSLPMLSVDMENKENGSVGVKNSMENGRPPDPADWAVMDVVNYFRTAGFEEQASAFQEQEIDGKSLLLMTRNDVLTGLQLKLGPALKIYEYHVKPLQTKHLKNNSS
ncbi:sterile alpha motif domain-containing protein 13 [Crocuta crocuta]